MALLKVLGEDESAQGLVWTNGGVPSGRIAQPLRNRIKREGDTEYEATQDKATGKRVAVRSTLSSLDFLPRTTDSLRGAVPLTVARKH